MQRKISILIAALLLLVAGPAFAAAKPHSTSTSRQFVVYGAEVRGRGAMCALAEATKTNLLRLLRLADNWKTPLLINLEDPQANVPETPAAHLEFSQTGFGLKLQLNLLVTADLNGRAVQRELLRALLIELMYRQRADLPAGTAYVEPPDWLLDGILQLAPGRDPDEPAQLLQTMVAAKKIAPLADVVGQRRELLDSSSRKIFEAYSAALLQLLIDSPDGRRKLARFISDLPASPNDPVADLRAHFPAVLGKSSNKWWALSVARLAATDRYEILSAAETAARLDRLLTFPVPDRSGTRGLYTLDQHEVFLKLPASASALRQLSRQLLLLATQAHPSYRAIVQEYYQLAELLARGETRKVRPRLARTASYREAIEHQAREIDDYMNWFEATQPKTMSGAFSQYLNAVTAADEALPRRRDPLSVYLDSVEMQGE